MFKFCAKRCNKKKEDYRISIKNGLLFKELIQDFQCLSEEIEGYKKEMKMLEYERNNNNKQVNKPLPNLTSMKEIFLQIDLNIKNATKISDFQEIKKTLDDLFRDAPNHGEIYFRYGNLEYSQQAIAYDPKHYEDAIKFYRKAVENGVKNAIALLGYCFHALGQYKEAIPYFIESEPFILKGCSMETIINSYTKLIDCYKKLNKFGNAILICEIAIKNTSSDANAYAHFEEQIHLIETEKKQLSYQGLQEKCSKTNPPKETPPKIVHHEKNVKIKRITSANNDFIILSSSNFFRNKDATNILQKLENGLNIASDVCQKEVPQENFTQNNNTDVVETIPQKNSQEISNENREENSNPYSKIFAPD